MELEWNVAHSKKNFLTLSLTRYVYGMYRSIGNQEGSFSDFQYPVTLSILEAFSIDKHHKLNVWAW